MALGGFALFATVSGLITLMAFDQTPGDMEIAPRQWPASTDIARHPSRATLLVFVHPLCGCTGATITELARFTALQNATALPGIIFVAAHAPNETLGQRNSWVKDASAIPGASIFPDKRGLEARRFGARTSGYVLLYGTGGNLLFQGGITGSRGHEGDNYGLSGLLTSLKNMRSELVPRGPLHSPVFGCSLGSGPADSDPGAKAGLSHALASLHDDVWRLRGITNARRPGKI